MAIYEKAKVGLDVDTNAKAASKEIEELNKRLKELTTTRASAIEANEYKYSRLIVISLIGFLK